MIPSLAPCLRKRALRSLFCLVVSCSLFACGGGGGSAPSAQPQPEPQPAPQPDPQPQPVDIRSAPYRWGSLAMGGGGYVTAVLPSTTERGLFYARTDVGGAYRWNSSTGRWVQLLDWVSEADVGLLGVESLALDPNNPSVLYVLAGTSYFSNGKTVVMRSTDHGATFARVTDVSTSFRVHGNGMGRGNGEKMQVDPGNSKLLYVGSRDNGLFKSTDAGASFTRLASLPVTTTPNGAGISFVLIDPGSVSGGAAQRIFVGVSRYGAVGVNLYRSDDAGSTFTPVTGAPAGYMPQRAALASDGNLFITYGNGAGPHGHGSEPEPMDAGQVWKYQVSSGSWTNVTPAGATSAFSGVTIDPRNPQRVLVSTINAYMAQGTLQDDRWGDQFFLSTDGGSRWTNVVQRGFALNTDGVTWIANNSIHWANSIEFDPFDTKAVWVTSGNGVFRTANIDATPTTWTFSVRGLEETVPLGLVSVPNGPVLSVIGDYDGFRHADIDQYAPIHSPRMGTTSALAVAPANPSMVVRAGTVKAYRSADTGASWTEMPTMLPADSRNTTNSSMVLSADGGVLLHGITIRSGGRSSTTFYRSTNHANANPSWSTVSGLGAGDVRPAADPVNADRFYVYDPSDGSVKVSTNGGASFSTTGSLATGGSPLLRAAPGREGDLWVALNGGGLARSTDAGSRFTTLANVASCSAVGFGKTMTGASYPSVFIWGAVSGNNARGLYRSTDAGATWVRINDDMHQYGGPGNGQFVVGDMNVEGRVYMSTVGRGVVYGTPVTP